MSSLRATLCLLPALAASCECRGDPADASLASDVGAAFAGCNEAEIKFLAAKHNVQLAFRPCGENAFSAYSWSPDGTLLYFQLVLSTYVMDADAPDRRTTSLPIAQATGAAAWLAPARLAIPVIPEAKESPARIGVVDLPPRPEEDGVVGAVHLVYRELPGLIGPEQLQRGDSPAEVLFAAREAADGPLALWRIDLDTGAVAPAFPWSPGAFETFTYSPEQRTVVLGGGGEVRTLDAAEGNERGRWPHARRGSLDPSGAWLMLEHDGAPISLYYQRAWDEVSDQARRRELARAERFEDGLPDSFPRDVHPPTLSVVDLAQGTRWTFHAFLGDHFQWYPPVAGWGAFFLWGFEGKQFKRNVTLLDLNDRLRAVGEGRSMLGVEPFVAPDAAPTPAP